MHLVEIEFRSRRRVIYSNPEDYPLTHKDVVIVQADRGIDLGYVNLVNERFEEYNKNNLEEGQEPEAVIRLAEAEDFERFKENAEHEAEARVFFKQEVTRLELVMKLVEVECQLDRRKLTFYFIADGRVDFRELVKSLAQKFHTRIDLRQIGARDESKRLGGIGICGRELCCPSWIREFKPVTTSMMKDQHMILNPQKNTGPCSKLRCCLRYEVDQYRELNVMLPKLGTQVKGPRGIGRVNKFSYNLEHVGIEWEDGAKYSYGIEHLTECSDWKLEDNDKIQLITFKKDPSQEDQHKEEREGELVARADPRKDLEPKVSVRSTPKKKHAKSKDKACKSCENGKSVSKPSGKDRPQVVQMEQVRPERTVTADDDESGLGVRKPRRSGSKRRGRSKKSSGAKTTNQQNRNQNSAEPGTSKIHPHSHEKQDAKESSEKKNPKKGRRRSGRGRNRSNTETQASEKKPRNNHSGSESPKKTSAKTQPSQPNRGSHSKSSSSQPKDAKPDGRPPRPRGRNRKR